MIPQLKNTVACLLTILIGAPLVACLFQYQMGELKTWSDFPDALMHGLFAAVFTAIGWLLLRSPFLGRFKELLLANASTKTDPSGVVTKSEQTAKLTVSDPAPSAKTDI